MFGNVARLVLESFVGIFRCQNIHAPNAGYTVPRNLRNLEILLWNVPGVGNGLMCKYIIDIYSLCLNHSIKEYLSVCVCLCVFMSRF